MAIPFGFWRRGGAREPEPASDADARRASGAVPPRQPAAQRGADARLETLNSEELMERYVGGNADAFDALYRQVAPKLFGYLLRLTRHTARAEDLLQITFSKVHRARASYLTGAPFLPWALAIARRSFYDERRAVKSRSEDLSESGILPEPTALNENVPADVAEALETALNALPEAYREAIQLTKITGLSMAEAADVLGTTESAVKLRVHRGYNLLRAELERFRRSGE